jgi:FkbM family methyltransferase
MDLNRLTLTRYGLMLYNKNDATIGKNLEAYGEWSQFEMDFMLPFIPKDGVCIDVGANIGTHTLFFANAVGKHGDVIAFEPQPIVFQLLCANVALNDLIHVHTFNIALSEKTGFVNINFKDYLKKGDFGRVRVAEKPQDNVYPAPGYTLDSFKFPRIDLIKIDVEGYEPQVILGGINNIKKYEPFIYAEYHPNDHTKDLLQILESLNYEVYFHRISYFNPNNFKNSQNTFGTIFYETNIFCVPRSKNIKVDLPKIKDISLELTPQNRLI